MPDEATGIAPPTVQLASLPAQWRTEAAITSPGAAADLGDMGDVRRIAHAGTLLDCAQELQDVLSISPRGCWEHPGILGYQHPECGFCWHGKDGLDVPGDRIEGPSCPRCHPQLPAGQVAFTRAQLVEALACLTVNIKTSGSAAGMVSAESMAAAIIAALADQPLVVVPASEPDPPMEPLFDITPEGTS